MHDYWTWEASIPNLAFFGLLYGLVWLKLRRLRLTIREEIQRLRETAPPYALGQQFIEASFEEIRQAIRDVTVRVEHVERLLEPDTG